jgi:hypothetical protein
MGASWAGWHGAVTYSSCHGAVGASRPEPGRPRNTYVREDQIVPHLAAIATLLAGPTGTSARPNRGLAQVTGPANTAALIDGLRARGVVLTYNPDDRTLWPRRSQRAGRRHRQGPLTAKPGKGGRPSEQKDKTTRRGRRLSVGKDRACS